MPPAVTRLTPRPFSHGGKSPGWCSGASTSVDEVISFVAGSTSTSANFWQFPIGVIGKDLMRKLLQSIGPAWQTSRRFRSDGACQRHAIGGARAVVSGLLFVAEEMHSRGYFPGNAL